MKLEKVREEVYYFSQKASELNQQLSIAGIALIWLFKVTTNGKIQFPLLHILALASFIISLTISIIYYSVLANNHYKKESIKLKKRIKEKDKIEEPEVDEPVKGNILGWFLFYGKLIFLLGGYIFFFIQITRDIEII